MPIRINLLAEQQAAEEARRRDPVKRSLWGGGFMIGLVLLWCVYKEVTISGARSELSTFETQWKQLQPSVLESASTLKQLADIEGRLDSLQNHSTNRFLWANILNALQQSTDRQVRVISVDGRSESTTQIQVLISSNIFAPAPAKRWLPWGEETSERNIAAEASTALNTITNGANLVRYQSFLTTASSITTNKIQIFAKIEVLKPITVTENIFLTIRARDYSSPHGSRVDAFFAGVTNLNVFRGFPSETNSSVQPESIQPRDDATDLIINPTPLYIPFTVSVNFPERIRASE